jgi:Putative Zn-dependent protease, contains TPR repeats
VVGCAAVAGLPVLLVQTKNSRQFESAADEYCFRLLKQKGYSPNAFAAIMERLAKKDEKEMGSFAYISIHPVTAERMKRVSDLRRKGKVDL